MRVLIGLMLSACVLTQPQPSYFAQTKATGGTMSCQQIVESCDTECGSPSCLYACGDRGSPVAQQQHYQVVACGQRNYCMNQDCMEAQCSAEMAACSNDPQLTGPAPQGPLYPQGDPQQPPPTTQAPGQQAP